MMGDARREYLPGQGNRPDSLSPDQKSSRENLQLKSQRVLGAMRLEIQWPC